MGAYFFVSFEKKRGGFVGYLSMESLSNDEMDHKQVILDAVNTYSNFVRYANRKIHDLEREKKQRSYIRARSIWQLGNRIVRLVNDLKIMDLEIDDLYAHLTRDLDKTRTWLSRVITFRTYMDNQKDIPKEAKWSQFVESPRKNVEHMKKMAKVIDKRSER